MFKNLLMKKMLKSQLKGMPEAEQEKIIKMVEDNPELFKKIALEAQEKIKSGQDRMTAMMEVMASRQEELKDILK